MSIEDDDEQTHLRHTCAVCGNELANPWDAEEIECDGCLALYDKKYRRIWPDDPLRDLQDM